MRMIMLSTVLCFTLILKFGLAHVNLSGIARVTQSSVYNYLGLAINAVDGNTDSIWERASCMSTKNDLNPWWRADLLRSHEIHSVRITNRGDCCPQRLNGAEIRIGDSLNNNGNNNPICATINFIAAGQAETFECRHMRGRYVNVIIPGRHEYLNFCEVEIYGSERGWDDC
ncbi:fucolectin-5-like [Scyliorhinus canicula]|uniref:fucolectin-5-like n=1 Tax=Scyliorhinus canicula TaxID=7830 RepID=UPI0018F7293C|nr:fucolectin-5-like [Scyliorhinus canicula]